MAQLTLNDLKKQVDKAVKEGHGDKYVVISDDNEGNGFHGLFFGVTTLSKEDWEFYEEANYDSIVRDYRYLVIVG